MYSISFTLPYNTPVQPPKDLWKDFDCQIWNIVWLEAWRRLWKASPSPLDCLCIEQKHQNKHWLIMNMKTWEAFMLLCMWARWRCFCLNSHRLLRVNLPLWHINRLLFDNISRYRLAHEYGIATDFTELWDRLQNEGRCCGVTGSQVWDCRHECL